MISRIITITSAERAEHTRQFQWKCFKRFKKYPSFLFSSPDHLMDHSPIRGLFGPDQVVRGKEDCANLYPRGRYTVGGRIREETSDAIRRQAEKSEEGLQASCPTENFRVSKPVDRHFWTILDSGIDEFSGSIFVKYSARQEKPNCSFAEPIGGSDETRALLIVTTYLGLIQ